jgi:UDP-N-acetylmuramoylalanine--D-glutamate ligase
MGMVSSQHRLGDVCVLGLGKTGIAVARYCLGQVASGRVSSVTLWGGATSERCDAASELTDAGVQVVLGSEEVRGSFDLVIASPGISEFSDFFRHAAACATEIMGEPEFAWRESPERWIGITGTNGKTTTTTLVRDLLRAGGSHAEAVGNIGTLAISEVPGRVEGGWFVAELSSFQLATTSELHPRVAVLLNVTPDHVAWHRSLANYAAAKERLFRNLDGHDLAVLSDDDETCRGIEARLEARGLRVCHLSCREAPKAPCAAYVDDGMLTVRLDGVESSLVRVDDLAIRGEHNVENALAAAACALEVGIDAEACRKGLLAFRPLEHRIEPAGELDGIRLVNDSKATNTDAVLKALTAFPAGRIVLLLGGHDKGCDLADFSTEVLRSAKAVVCFGDAAGRMEESLHAAGGGSDVPVLHAEHLTDALDAGIAAATSGDVVLLSPACSSFDEFSGFEERGRVFKRLCAERIAQAGERD